MRPKERVRLTIAHQRPDRVAIDFGARGEVIQSLMTRLRVSTESQLLDRLGVDLRFVAPRYRGPCAHEWYYADPTAEVTAEGLYRDIWGVGFRANTTTNGFYMDLADSPLAGVTSVLDLDRHSWPTADLWDYSTLAPQAASLGDHWLWAHSRGIFEISWFLRGFENFLLDLVAEPEMAQAVMDRVQHYLFERTRRILEAGDGMIDMVEYNDDVGSQKGMLISPELWRRYLKPRMAAFIRLCREYGVRIRYHSCGSIGPIIPDLVEIGVDVLNPVQTAAAGMNLEDLKKKFGRRLTFNGGIDTERLLPTASRNQVYAEVSRLLGAVAADGGYILAPSHVFQPDVPVENVLAVYEAALPDRARTVE